jgi:hypothetical protein
MNIELKPIAESKVRQLGGDVCGVLVRKDGKLAAVDEHGRVQWLQSERGSEPVAWSWEYRGLHVSADKAFIEKIAADGFAVRPLVFADTQPARAQGGQGTEVVAWASPLPDGTEQVTKELPERIYGVVPKDYQWYVRPLVYADTRPQPAVPDDLRKHIERMLELHEKRGVVLSVHMQELEELITTPTTPQADGWKVKFMQIMSEIYSDLDDEHEDPIPSDLWDLWRDLRAATQPPAEQESEGDE